VTQTAFREGEVEADGFRIRYLDAGHGTPLVHLRAAGKLELTPAHGHLSRHCRVVVFETPGSGQSRETSGTGRGRELASTMVRAIDKLGIDTFNLIGSSVGGTMALWLALHAAARVLALVLEAPAALDSEYPDADLESRLPALATPTLVLFGTRDDVIPPKMARVYKELIPNSHLVFLYDAAHAISTDRPEAFADVVLDFLERREAFVISRRETVIHP
jgi:pimeloyl-ACP methyl ester carboxylesterase